MICGKDFKVKPSWIKIGGGKYCSRDCMYKGKNKSKERKRDCNICNKEFYPRGGQLKNGKGKYCSQKCFRKWFKKENNPLYKGGIENESLTYKQSVLKKREKIAGRKRPNQCEICGAMGKICFDHDHETGKFRGWICLRCNFALGLVKDNIEILFTMIKYLKNYLK